jgi:hypothetical protein
MFIIELNTPEITEYVTGFSNTLAMLETTSSTSKAKRFGSPAEARTWAARYAASGAFTDYARAAL